MVGEDNMRHSHATHDLYNAIDEGNFPVWNFAVQARVSGSKLPTRVMGWGFVVVRQESSLLSWHFWTSFYGHVRAVMCDLQVLV